MEALRAVLDSGVDGAFVEGLTKSTAMVLVSEIGDKTFFIAAFMAMRNPQLTVLAGALGALWVMTALSAAMGWAAPALISPTLTHHAATGLFFLFGLRTLYSALFAWEGGSGEMEEVEAELKAKSKKAPKGKGKGKAAEASHLISPVLVEVFVMTFLAEWGDRSQIATIGLAASSNPLGVTLGGCLGHAVCTSAAVVGGRSMASMISERAVALSGGALFLAFGLHSLLTGPEVVGPAIALLRGNF